MKKFTFTALPLTALNTSYCLALETNKEAAQNEEACSSMEGTYQIEGSPYNFYLKPDHKSYDSYRVVFELGEKKLTETHTLIASKERREHEGLPECAIMIPQAGMLVKVKKGDSTQTLQSQNYTTQRTFTQDYALFVFAGFASDVLNVKKISDSAEWDKSLKMITLEEAARQSDKD